VSVPPRPTAAAPAAPPPCQYACGARVLTWCETQRGRVARSAGEGGGEAARLGASRFDGGVQRKGGRQNAMEVPTKSRPKRDGV
jgi:hypothetical protein